MTLNPAEFRGGAGFVTVLHIRLWVRSDRSAWGGLGTLAQCLSWRAALQGRLQAGSALLLATYPNGCSWCAGQGNTKPQEDHPEKVPAFSGDFTIGVHTNCSISHLGDEVNHAHLTPCKQLAVLWTARRACRMLQDRNIWMRGSSAPRVMGFWLL